MLKTANMLYIYSLNANKQVKNRNQIENSCSLLGDPGLLLVPKILTKFQTVVLCLQFN